MMNIPVAETGPQKLGRVVVVDAAVGDGADAAQIDRWEAHQARCLWVCVLWGAMTSPDAICRSQQQSDCAGTRALQTHASMMQTKE